MVSPITATQPPIHTAPASASAVAAPPPQQMAALRQLMVSYAADQTRDVAATTLSSLGKQILAMAHTLGEHVTLPQGAAGPGAIPASGKVNLTV